MTEFNRGIDALRKSVGVESRKLVEKETAELIKTLVRLTPPKNLATSKKSATTDVRKVFRAVPNKIFDGVKEGKGATRWLYAAPYVLLGVNREHFLPNLGTEDGFKKYKSTRGKFGVSSQRMHVRGFVVRRGQQAMMRTARVVTSAKTIASIVNRVHRNFGRQKAGWLVSVFSGVIKLAGGNMPPKWVTRHIDGARGRFEDGLAVPSNPSFTIVNTSKGISSAVAASVVKTAVAIRARAMIANAKLFVSGKKKLSDYK